MSFIAILLSSLSLIVCAQPLPPVESFPFTPYVEPESPEQIREREARAQAVADAYARHDEALQALALRVGAPTGETFEAVSGRAEALNAVAVAVDNDVPMTQAAGGAGTAAVAAAIAGYLAGRKQKGV